MAPRQGQRPSAFLFFIFYLCPRSLRQVHSSNPLSLALQLTAGTTRSIGRVYFEIPTRKIPHIYSTSCKRKRHQNSTCKTRRKEQKKHLECYPYNTVKAKENKGETSPKDGIPPLYSPKSPDNPNGQPLHRSCARTSSENKHALKSTQTYQSLHGAEYP